jgi:hypothetical protein
MSEFVVGYYCKDNNRKGIIEKTSRLGVKNVLTITWKDTGKKEALFSKEDISNLIKISEKEYRHDKHGKHGKHDKHGKH